jgi:hypothetical protein
MKKRGFAQLAGIFLLGMSLLSTGGCGYKNPPVPPAKVVPQAIEDLRYSITDKGVQLSWSFPVKTIKGSQLDEISSFELYRADVPVEDYCGSCPIPYAAPMTVGGGPTFDGETRRKATYEASMLTSGNKYFFKVRSRTSWWAESDDSNVVTFVWFEPAPAPTGLTVAAADSKVTLSWQPVSPKQEKGSGTGISYQVLRSIDGKDYAKIGDPQKGTSYVDRQVTNGQKYFYQVQTLTSYKNELAEGVVSKEVTGVPVDLTPPPPPTGVAAVKTADGIKIFWDRVETEPIAEYRIYRRAANQDSYKLLGKVEPKFTQYIDAKATEDVRYYYAVTAVDTAPSANESQKSKEVTVR